MKKSNKFRNYLTIATLLIAVSMSAQQQGALAAAESLGTAATSIKSYATPVQNICFAIGGVVGLIGGIRIYNKWNSGDQDINKELVSYGGAMLFLVLVPSIVMGFFG